MGQRIADDMAQLLRGARRAAAVSCAALALQLAGGCEQDEVPATPTPVLKPAPPALARLTRAQFDNTIGDILGPGLTLPPQLEPDVAFGNLVSVGASVAKVSPRGIELYEEAARSLAAQIAGKSDRVVALGGCITPTAAGDTAQCAGQMVDNVGPKLWRRALSAAERATAVAIGVQAAKAIGTDSAAVQYALVYLLQHPSFLYRVELGEPDPTHPGSRRLTATELASRLSYFLWDGPPDAELLKVAVDGSLHTHAVLQAQIERMMAHPLARRAGRNFAREWLQLAALDGLSKDPKVYKHYSSDLGASAREETLKLFEHLVFDQDTDLRQLLTTTTTFVDRRLAAIYDIAAQDDQGHYKVELPASAERRGLLGHVSFLAMAAHAVSSSPTLRGIYLRRHLLCDSVPDPPSNLNTALPEPDATAKTMRQRLTTHMSVPYCAGCHRQFDPIGLGLERFDGIGRWRSSDNGELIDATGKLDGTPFWDLGSLGKAVANSPKFRACVVQKVYAYAVGRPISDGELGQLDSLDKGFEASGMRLKALMRDVALSEGFRRVGAVQGGAQ